MNIYVDLKDNIIKLLTKLGLMGGDKNPQDQPIDRRPLRPRPPKGPASISFGKFLLVKMPQPKSNTPNYADAEEVERFANEVGEQIKQAFATHKINNYVHVEIYPTASNSILLKKYFGDDMAPLIGACEDKLFGGRGEFDDGQELDSSQGYDVPRVYLINRNLQFDPAYDSTIQNRMVVRPLERGKIYAPVDYTEMRPGMDQLILGQMIIRQQREKVQSAEICAWMRSDADQNSAVIDVDFDLLARAESLKDEHKYPLGLSFYCTFKHTNVKREIDEVLLDITDAKEWMRKVGTVRYFVDTGGGRSYKSTPVSDYPEDEPIRLRREGTPRPFKLGENQVININRWIDIIANADGRERRYSFGFFDRAIKFSADQNIFRVTGQLLPADKTVEVMLHPSPNQSQRPVFTLVPKGGTTPGYTLTLKEGVMPPMTAAINNGPLMTHAGDTADISINDEITVRRASAMSGDEDLHKFKLQQLNDLQQAYASKVGRNYAHFLSLNATKDIVLSGKKHTFGRGRSFHPSSADMEMSALIFEREWVSVRMRAGKSPDGNEQLVAYRNVARTPSPASDPLTDLSGDGITLDLNGSYLVYIGDYEITLILNATPTAAELMSR